VDANGQGWILGDIADCGNIRNRDHAAGAVSAWPVGIKRDARSRTGSRNEIASGHSGLHDPNNSFGGFARKLGEGSHVQALSMTERATLLAVISVACLSLLFSTPTARPAGLPAAAPRSHPALFLSVARFRWSAMSAVPSTPSRWFRALPRLLLGNRARTGCEIATIVAST
jgi:hypothetical protein